LDNSNLTTSRHSSERCKERLGLSKKQVGKMAEKALTMGVTHNDVSGSLKRYVGWLYESHNREANNIILYNREIYIFKDKRLITIFHLPHQYCEVYDKVQKKKTNMKGEI
jgi:hypothetical protein